jgi:cellulose synthase/poly-beta-1,6-N-acetylglucosamine synthase-like glycosyltransferase
MKLFIYLLFIYLTVYTVYYLALVYSGLRYKKRRPFDAKVKQNNLCVVVYAHNNKKTLENLIKQLKNQTYPKNNYLIQVILDNCTDESEILLQGDLDVTVMNVKNVDTIGKEQAYSILTEKYSTIPDLDAYVFLDARYYVNADFLEKINDSLQDVDALTGATTLICNNELSLLDNIKYSYNQYKNNFLLKSRDALGLNNSLNSDILAVKKSVIDSVQDIKLKTTDDELRLTLSISELNYKCGFNNNVKVYLGIDDYDLRIPSLSARIGLFLQMIKNFRVSDIRHSELITSLIYPNCLTLALGYFVLFNFTLNYKCFLNYYFIGGEIALFLIAFCASLLHAKIHSKEHFYLFLYPVYTFCRVVYNLPFLRFIRDRILTSGDAVSLQKLNVHVNVYDGKRYYPCKLEIVSESGLSRVIFINKKKKYKTKNHLRVVDAIREISEKLESYGYTLLLCQCCKYFKSNVDGTVNQVKGFCEYQFANRTPGDILSTVLWNYCDAFEKMNVVNMFDAIASRQKETNKQ